MRLILAFVAICSSLTLLSCAHRAQFDYSELLPILRQNNLSLSYDLRHLGVEEIEEADSKLYGPLAGTTIYVESPSPAFDSGDVRPRYWLRIEDFATPEKAAKRASEYNVGSYERLRNKYPSADKISVRIWSIARGKRVYALTTDSSFLTYIAVPKNLRKSISMLPET